MNHTSAAIKYRCDNFDEFISNNEPATPRQRFYFQISPSDLLEGKKLLSKLKTYEAPYYEFFGSNALRNTSFALYKSSNNIIYMMVIRTQKPINYIIVQST
jgi:hypothetical protein